MVLSQYLKSLEKITWDTAAARNALNILQVIWELVKYKLDRNFLKATRTSYFSLQTHRKVR